MKRNETQTLRNLVETMKCRKGKADGITRDGSYWIAVSVDLLRYGGDGIGQDAADMADRLTIRHYRNGEIRCYLHVYSWHQNSGSSDEKTRADKLLECQTIEELAQMIQTVEKPRSWGETDFFEYSDKGLARLAEIINLPGSQPSPDDE